MIDLKNMEFTIDKSVSARRNNQECRLPKSAVLWGCVKGTNDHEPLLFFTKPRGISEEDYKKILDALDIRLNIGDKND